MKCPKCGFKAKYKKWEIADLHGATHQYYKCKNRKCKHKFRVYFG